MHIGDGEEYGAEIREKNGAEIPGKSGEERGKSEKVRVRRGEIR